MSSRPTTVNTLTPDQFAARIAANFPPGWASAAAKQPGGVTYAVYKVFGTEVSFQNGAVQYVLAATRIQNAIDTALDIAAEDYFGSALPRGAGESDDAYRARILAALLPAGATRQAVSDAVEAVTGYVPRIIEPWRPADTGALDVGPGNPMTFWDVDSMANPFRWTGGGSAANTSGITGRMAYQGLIECVLPPAMPFGNNPTPCFDTFNSYWDEAGGFDIYFIDPTALVPIGEAEVYAAINRTKCEGTIAWVKFVPPPSPSWDTPGDTWDSGLTWQ